MKFNALVDKYLKQAVTIATAAGSDYVCVEHLLYGLFQVPGVRDSLTELQFPYLKLKKLVKKRIAAKVPRQDLWRLSLDLDEQPSYPVSNSHPKALPYSLSLRRLLDTSEEQYKKRLEGGYPSEEESTEDEGISPTDVTRALVKLLVESKVGYFAALMKMLEGPYHKVVPEGEEGEESPEKMIEGLGMFDPSNPPPLDLAMRCFSVFVEKDEEEENDEEENTSPPFLRFMHPAMGASSSKGKGSLLKKYGRNLIEDAVKYKFDPLIGRVDELERLIQVLMRRRKNNPILIGEAGVGKTAIVHELARRIALGDVPECLRSTVIFSIDVATMLAGTKYRGEFEERMTKIIKEILDHPEYILFIDEIHTIWGAGSTSSDRSGDLSNILKPHLSTGRLRCIGATTYEDYRSTIQKDKALARRLQQIDISEPTVEQSIKILRGLKKHYEEFHKVVFTDAAIDAAVRLSSRHIASPPNPDKAIDVIDEAGSCHRAYASNYETNVIDEAEIKTVVSKIARIPNLDLFSDEKEKLRNLESVLKGSVFGQDAAIESVVRAVKLGRAGLKNNDRPIASFLFAGPTGVGKTELAKQLASALQVEFIRYDMSEYSEKHSVSRLVGADPGYVGFEQGGQLTNAVIKHPHSVILFDEIEKADPNVYNIFLQIMDAARLTDNIGREANFRNTIIIMTSNVGARGFEQGRVGFDRDVTKNWDSSQINKVFSPEFRNRLDEIIAFSPLPREVVIKIVEKFVKETEFQLAEQKVTFQLSDEVKSYFAECGYDPKLGARPLDRLIQKELKAPLADEILFGGLVNGGSVIVTLGEDQKIKLEIDPSSSPSKE